MDEPIGESKKEPPTEPSSDTKQEATPIKIDSPIRVIINNIKHNWGNISERIMAALTVVIAIAAIATVLYVSHQTTIQERALVTQITQDSISRVHQDSINSLIFKAQIIRDSSYLASSKMVSKAYLFIMGITPPKVGALDLTVTLSNSGWTPAFLTGARALIKLDSTGISDSEIRTFTQLPLSDVIHHGDLVPFPLGMVNRFFTAQDSVNICWHRKNYYFAGEFTYMDVYGKQAILRFNKMFVPELGGFWNYNEKNHTAYKLSIRVHKSPRRIK